ncbi:MAG: NAD(P)/FAD-dependent oxidoreductase [Elusimicrobia bacterium]|nr:NAD(P)/FAD-dependent oxidoreductase [Elusimicrobiota bacterium]
MRDYDVVVIGAGPGGYRTAEELAARGKKVCLVELFEERIGGTCLNEGCIPMKSLLEFSQRKHLFSTGIEAGKFAKENVSSLRKALISVLKSEKIEFLFGRAKFVSEKEISVLGPEGSEKKVSADYFVIATGSRPKLPASPVGGPTLPAGGPAWFAPDGKSFFTSDNILKSDLRFGKILIIGAGYVGCEFASFFRGMNSQVTVVEVAERILPEADREISKTLFREFRKRGIEIIVSGMIAKIRTGKGIEAEISAGSSKILRNFDAALSAVGRVPNTENLGAEEIGIKMENGFILTGKNFETNVKNIFAVGDCINAPALAYVAYRQAAICASSICGEKCHEIDYEKLPKAVFSDPPAAWIGISGETAAERGLEVTIFRKFFRANSKAVLMRKPAGFVKIVCEKKSGRILGCFMVGAEVFELIHIFSVAVSNNLTSTDLRKSVFIHPTLSELISDTLR